MAHQNQFGLFSYTNSVGQGDPYGKNEKHKTESKFSGKQFGTSPLKKGKTQDAYFSPKMLESVFVGCKYTTLYSEDKKYQLEKKAKQVVPGAFKPSTPSRRPEGQGSKYGTFSGYENMKADDSYDKRKEGKETRAPGLKNFLTSPPKRGHDGLLSCRGANGKLGIAGEYRYEMQPPLPRKPSTAPPTPFRPSHPPKKGSYSQDCLGSFTR